MQVDAETERLLRNWGRWAYAGNSVTTRSTGSLEGKYAAPSAMDKPARARVALSGWDLEHCALVEKVILTLPRPEIGALAVEFARMEMREASRVHGCRARNFRRNLERALCVVAQRLRIALDPGVHGRDASRAA